jgi:hypothetical protein
MAVGQAKGSFLPTCMSPEMTARPAFVLGKWGRVVEGRPMNRPSIGSEAGAIEYRKLLLMDSFMLDNAKLISKRTGSSRFHPLASDMLSRE